MAQVDTSMYARREPVRLLDPMEHAMRAESLQRNMLQRQQAEMEIESAQRGQQRQTQLRNALAGGKRGADLENDLLSQGFIDEAKGLAGERRQQETHETQQAKARRERQISVMTRTAQMLTGVKDQAGWENALRFMESVSEDEDDVKVLSQIPRQFTPEWRDQLVRSTMSTKDQLELERQADSDRYTRANQLVTLDTQGQPQINQPRLRAEQQIAGTRAAAAASAQLALLAPQQAATAADRVLLSRELGVPVARRDPYAGMSVKGREAMQSKLYAQADKMLGDLDSEVSNAKTMANELKRFVELQGSEGVRYQQGPFMGRVMAISDRAQEMDAISSKIVPKMREPGSGATSDFDAKMFQTATVGRTKNPVTNEAIARGYAAASQLMEERAAFMRDYLTVNGHLDGAQNYWRKYVEANPIFDRRSTADNMMINERRQGYREFFSNTREGVPAAPASPGTPRPAAPAARPAAAPATRGGLTYLGPVEE